MRQKLFAILLFIPLISTAVYAATGACYSGNIYSPTSTVNNSNVRIVSYGTVRICSEPATGIPCIPLATGIYKDGALAQPLTNPFTTDQYGNYTFCVNPSTPVSYHLQTSGPKAPTSDLPYVTFAGGSGGGGTPGFGAGSGINMTGSTSPNIQSAITAAGTNGGPVTIPQNYAGKDSFTNPNNIRVDDYRQQFAIDSLFFRSTKEFGVKADGQILSNCITSSSSPVLTCPTAHFVNAPVASGGDVGKIAIVRGNVGPSTGRMFGWSVVSGGSGGTDGFQPVTFTGLTCTVPYSTPTADFGQPIVYVRVVGGVPQSGPVTQNPVSYGIGCTGTPPTTGTVATVTGTVTFSGGQVLLGDLPTKILSVIDSTHVTLADNAGASVSNAVFFYGTDDNDGVSNHWNSACNAMSSGGASFGHLTFSGISMISRGIDCLGAGIHIEGSGIQNYNQGGGSVLLYAGKNTGDHVIQMGSGAFAGMERLRIDGNSVALPVGLLLSEGAPGFGSGPNAQDRFTQIAFGSYIGDTKAGNFAVIPQLKNCVYAHAVFGNDDFNTFDNIHCWASKVGTDSDNNQATGWRIGYWNSSYNEIGFSTWGGMQIKNYFTEFNRLDMMIGSPTSASGFPGTAIFEEYNGESSSEQIAGSPLFGSLGRVIIEDAFGNATIQGQIQSSGVAVDFRNGEPAYFKYNGGMIGTMLRIGGCAPAQTQFDVTTFPESVIYASGYGPCGNLFAQPQTLYVPDVNGIGQSDINIKLLRSTQSLAPTQTEITEDTYTHIIGSIDVTSPAPPGQTDDPSTPVDRIGFVTVGTPGSTTYNYQISCVGSDGRETNAITFPPLTTGNSTLSTTNYNQLFFWNHIGCPNLNLYGDEGSGAIGFLAAFRAIDLQPYGSAPYPNLSISDKGAYTKLTAISPPEISESGAVNANVFQENGINYSTFHLDDWLHTDFSQYKGDVAESDGNQYKSSFLFPNATGIPGITSGGGSIQYGYTTNPTASAITSQNVIYFRPIDVTQNTQADSMVLRFSLNTTAATANVAIYKANGKPVSGFAYKQPGLKVCDSGAGTLISVGDNTYTLPSCKLSEGNTYWLAWQINGAVGPSVLVPIDNLGGPPPETLACATGLSHSGIFPKNITKLPDLACAVTAPLGEWPKLYINGTLQPFINPTVSSGVAGHGACWKTAGTLGYCSTAMDSSGNCTCN